MTEPFVPLYAPRRGPVRPRESEAYDIVSHFNSMILAGGSISLDQDEENEVEDDPHQSLDELELECGTLTEADVASLVAAFKRYAGIGNPNGSDDE